jgi:hypothetical protein
MVRAAHRRRQRNPRWRRAWFITGGEEGLGVEYARDIRVISPRVVPG